MSDKNGTLQKYGDIIHMERPWPEETLRKHPRMSVADRAKIFAAFAALTGHSARLAVEDQKLLRQQRPELSEGEVTVLSEKLAQVTKGMQVMVTYFMPDDKPDVGYIASIAGNVAALEPVEQFIRVDDTIISLKNIISITGEGMSSKGEAYESV